MRDSGASIKSLITRYRVEVHCLNCGRHYVTRLIDGLHPIECKYCRSRKLGTIKRWKI